MSIVPTKAIRFRQTMAGGSSNAVILAVERITC